MSRSPTANSTATLDRPGHGGLSNQWLMAIVLAFSLPHVVLSWGYIGTFCLDSGCWLHEVARFVCGEVLYRDFVWPFPPVAICILGGVARLFGIDVTTIGAVTSLVFVLLSGF